MVRCLIVDDEPLAHQVLEYYIAQTPNMVVTGNCRHAMEAYEFLSIQKIDLLFLDIEMPLVNGVNFLKALPSPPRTILTTAYKEYAFEGYELEVVDYLLKPFSFERFTKAVEKFDQLTLKKETQPSDEKYLIVKEPRGMVKVNYKDILYIEADKDYMQIFTHTKTYLLHETMKDLAEKLANDNFVRTHRSFIVAVNHIKFLQNDSITLSNDVQVPIGRNYKKHVTDNFQG